MKTLVTRIKENSKQYNESNRIVKWIDATESRWSKTYNNLNISDNAIFICKEYILIGKVSLINKRKSIQVDGIVKYAIKNDELLQLNEFSPEYSSRVKANFFPFIHDKEIDIKKLVDEIINKKFIQYYIFENIVHFENQKKMLNLNDRVVILNNGAIENIYLFKNNKLIIAPFNGLLNTIGKTLKELLEININHKGGNSNSNNVKRIRDIQKDLKSNNYYKFNSFFAYHDSLYNSSAYGKTTKLKNSISQINSIDLLNHPLNQILFGPPGTGKTYNTINKALEIIGVDVTNLDRKSIKEEFDKKMKDGQIVFTTFHQSMSYEDFIEGIKPKTNNDGIVTYDIEDGIFKLISNKAEINYLNSLELSTDFDEVFEILKTQWIESDNSEIDVKMKGNSFWITNITNRNIKFRKPSGGTGHDLVIKTLKDLYDNKRQMDSGLAIYYYPLIEKLRSFSKKSNKKNEIKNYVLIIDEINRGNVSQIFGELITLIEEDKRIGKDEALELTLPYSKESFGVPPNLYLIGTMNTADRSVEAIDTALRRRFSFTEMPPRYDLDLLTYEYAGTTGKVILETINARIEKLLDKDHLIGHSFFLKKDEEDAEAKLKNSFYRNIIPLLQEYFYGDYAKIGAVLGSGFVKLKEENGNDKIFAEFDGFESGDYIEKNTYQIVDYRLVETNYSIKKEGKLILMDFEKAIKLLINMSVD
jgi:hypothetical protein